MRVRCACFHGQSAAVQCAARWAWAYPWTPGRDIESIATGFSGELRARLVGNEVAKCAIWPSETAVCMVNFLVVAWSAITHKHHCSVLVAPLPPWCLKPFPLDAELSGQRLKHHQNSHRLFKQGIYASRIALSQGSTDMKGQCQ